jgi:hypothetical protein
MVELSQAEKDVKRKEIMKNLEKAKALEKAKEKMILSKLMFEDEPEKVVIDKKYLDSIPNPIDFMPSYSKQEEHTEKRKVKP